MTANRNLAENAIENKSILNGVLSEMSPITIIRGLKDRFLYRIATLGFDMIILVIMALLLMGSALAMGGRIRLFQATVLLPIVIMFVSIVIKIKRNPGAWHENVHNMLRDWVPFVLVVFIYENMHDVAGQVMGFDIAGYLNQIDAFIFGVEPTIWAQRIFSPLLTDVMSISYALYFALPLFVMFLFSTWGWRYEFQHMALTMTMSFMMGFVGYVFLPCSPPRYFMEFAYTDPPKLYGLFIFNNLQGAWDSLSVVSGGAFPSLHVGLSAVALIYAFKFRKANTTLKIVWYAYIPLVFSLWFSTVYLRHHWVVDIFAGIVVATVALIVSNALMKVWRKLRISYGLPL